MANKKPVIKRTRYLINTDELSKMLAYLARRDKEESIRFTKRIFYARKGNDNRPLTYDEAQKIISKGFK